MNEALNDVEYDAGPISLSKVQHNGNGHDLRRIMQTNNSPAECQGQSIYVGLQPMMPKWCEYSNVSGGGLLTLRIHHSRISSIHCQETDHV